MHPVTVVQAAEGIKDELMTCPLDYSVAAIAIVQETCHSSYILMAEEGSSVAAAVVGKQQVTC